MRRFAALAAAALCIAAGRPLAVDWSWGPVMPLAKSCRATAASADSVYTVGGTYWENKVKHWSAAAFRLDMRALEWTRLPDYPLPAGYASAVVVSGRLWVIGGQNGEHGHSEVFTLDLSRRDARWAPGPALPEPRSGQVSGAIGSTIYLGGPGGHDVLALDTEQRQRGWEVVARMPESKVEWQSGAACGGKLYIFGGLTAGPRADKGWMPQREAVAFDPRRRVWESIPQLPMPLGSGAATAIDGRFIAIAAGYSVAVPAERTPDRKARTWFSTRCLLYDTVRREYRSIGDMPMGVTDEGLAFVRGTLVAIGGEDSPWQTRTDLVMLGRVRR